MKFEVERMSDINLAQSLRLIRNKVHCYLYIYGALSHRHALFTSVSHTSKSGCRQGARHVWAANESANCGAACCAPRTAARTCGDLRAAPCAPIIALVISRACTVQHGSGALYPSITGRSSGVALRETVLVSRDSLLDRMFCCD